MSGPLGVPAAQPSCPRSQRGAGVTGEPGRGLRDWAPPTHLSQEKPDPQGAKDLPRSHCEPSCWTQGPAQPAPQDSALPLGCGAEVHSSTSLPRWCSLLVNRRDTQCPRGEADAVQHTHSQALGSRVSPQTPVPSDPPSPSPALPQPGGLSPRLGPGAGPVGS